jgi:hypothetical protein
VSKYHITLKSSNRKTGNLIVVTSSNDTCPDACPFKSKGCYALGGPLRLHWDKISKGERGFSFKTLLSKLKDLPKDSKVRLWQAGDMPGKGNTINLEQVKKLISVIDYVTFGYTHKPLDVGNNKEAIKLCNDNGVTINLSANNLQHADELYDAGIGPVAVTLLSSCTKSLCTPKGRKIKICPAALNKEVHCNSCGGDNPLCSRANRDYIIGFPAHGNGKVSVEKQYETG